MFKKRQILEPLKEVRVGAFVAEPRIKPEPDTIIELDANSFKRFICYIDGDTAIDRNGNSFHILQREKDGKIKSSERSIIKANQPYALEVKDIDLSKKEQKEF